MANSVATCTRARIVFVAFACNAHKCKKWDEFSRRRKLIEGRSLDGVSVVMSRRKAHPAPCKWSFYFICLMLSYIFVCLLRHLNNVWNYSRRYNVLQRHLVGEGGPTPRPDIGVAWGDPISIQNDRGVRGAVVFQRDTRRLLCFTTER